MHDGCTYGEKRIADYCLRFAWSLGKYLEKRPMSLQTITWHSLQCQDGRYFGNKERVPHLKILS